MYITKTITQDDIDRYDLENIYNSFHEHACDFFRIEFHQSWTVDFENKVFLMLVDHIEEYGPSGLPQYVTGYVFCLSISGTIFKAILKKLPSRPKKPKGTRRVIDWKLIDIKPLRKTDLSKEFAISKLSESICEFGDSVSAHRKAHGKEEIVEITFSWNDHEIQT